MKWNNFYMAPDDGGAGGGGGNDDKGGGDTPPNWAGKLETGMTGLTTAINSLMELAKTNNQNNQGVRQVVEDTTQDDDTDEEMVSAADLETMSRAEFLAYQQKLIFKAIEKHVVGPISARLDSITQATTAHQLTQSVKELEANNKDFNDWKPEMIELAKQMPGVPIHRLYILAKAEDPKKAKELDAKYNPPSRDGGRPIKITGFGGLLPNGSGTGTKGRKMNGMDAATAAWAETVAALGGEPVFEE